jgi:signal transduction histidine kinase
MITPHLPRSWQRRDLVIAGIVTLVELIGLRTGPPAATPSAALGTVGLLLSLAQGVPLLWRRSHPEAVLGITAAAFVAYALLLVAVPPYGALVALATLAVRREARAAAAATALLVAACAVAYLPPPGPADDVAPPAVVAVVVGVTAQLVRERRVRIEAQARRVAAEERLRIARDLHDVLGHSLGGIAVQSSTGRLALDAGAPDAARDALVAIESASRESMREVREVLGVLRESGTPGLEGLDDLVGSSRAAGLTVQVARQGDLDGLPPDTSRTAYRVLQEALTNAAKHAGPGPVHVTVRRTTGLLAVEVVDEGGSAPALRPDGPPGHGLVGMRERVTAAGGTMAAGPGPDAGWRVRVELPATGRRST